MARGSGSESQAAGNIHAVVALNVLENDLLLLQKLIPTPQLCLPAPGGRPAMRQVVWTDPISLGTRSYSDGHVTALGVSGV